MANDNKPGFFDNLLGSLGLKKAEPAPAPAPVRPRTGNTGPMAKKLGTGEQFVRSKTGPTEGSSTGPIGEKKAITAQLSPEEKSKQSEERRYLIAAYESTPTLIPEFQNPQYMYKLISNERDFTQEQLNMLLQERKQILLEHSGTELPESLEHRLNELDLKAQEYRNDLTRLFLLIKKVAGVQKSGTGGTDFLDPLKR